MKEIKENIRITLFGMIKDGETFLFKDKALTLPIGSIKSRSSKDRKIIFRGQDYDLKIQNNE